MGSKEYISNRQKFDLKEDCCTICSISCMTKKEIEVNLGYLLELIKKEKLFEEKISFGPNILKRIIGHQQKKN